MQSLRKMMNGVSSKSCLAGYPSKKLSRSPSCTQKSRTSLILQPSSRSCRASYPWTRCRWVRRPCVASCMQGSPLTQIHTCTVSSNNLASWPMILWTIRTLIVKSISETQYRCLIPSASRRRKKVRCECSFVRASIMKMTLLMTSKLKFMQWLPQRKISKRSLKLRQHREKRNKCSKR